MRVRKAFKVAVAAIAMGVPALTLAGGSSDHVKIVSLDVNVTSGDLVFIQVTGKKDNGPACSKNAAYSYVLQIGSPISDALFRMILKARVSGTSVSLSGTGMCPSNSGVELLEGMSY